MVFKPIYILILLFTIVIDYVAGIYIDRNQGRKRKAFLILSLVANIGVLAFFKYYNFFTININLLSGLFHFKELPILSILLPIGLSFHTFQAMSYTIEIYRGNFKPEKHFGYYALYVMYYPQLVAGPIERPQNLLHQFKENHPLKYANITNGLKQMLYGFFKKIVIADNVGYFVNTCYNNHQNLYGFQLILCFIFFAVQIYCDFSGYSDIAIGASKVMGIDLMKNFNNPFISKNITEFWRRWHISLSTWFNDYLFKPFVVEKRDWGKGAVVVGLLMTFVLSGLWHGAGWTFIIFGSLHGLAIVFEFLTKKYRTKIAKKIPSLIYDRTSQLLTFCFLVFTWIFFRAPNVSTAFEMMAHSLQFGKGTVSLVFPTGKLYVITILLIFAVFDFVVGNVGFIDYINSKEPSYRMAVISVLLIFILYFGVFNSTSFIYFQF